ncbi:hypothetical protein [Microvirga puerhi]|uniref:Uncharacterized protein n=1 Tax=Microvirga puerhi TaxID=2876078 RepID=A0ABS7VNE1_9HYPH|nr:hypothetical protein [Microvirga puerhi]MBZ6076749.1 hypothetical protein [Microvirga puerhi]
MALGMRLAGWRLGLTCALVFLAASATASRASLRPAVDSPAIILRFDPVADETRIANRVGDGLCVALVLPQKWAVEAGDDLRTVLRDSDGAELEAVLRPAREVRDLPQSDLASQDAAFLQRDHEGLFGRPAQAATLASLSAGIKRWTATWIDASFPAASREVTLDTVIIPLTNDWLLELSLSDVESPSTYEAMIAKILSGVRLEAASACRPQTR